MIIRSGETKLSNLFKMLKKYNIKPSLKTIKATPAVYIRSFRRQVPVKVYQGSLMLVQLKMVILILRILKKLQMNSMNFFVNVASKLKEPVLESNHDRLSEFCQSKLPFDMKFTIPQIQNEKVLKFLSTMDTSKATGTDMIGPRLLKLAAPYIANEVTFICNHSINNSVFPNKWKEAKVTPLHKNGPLEEVNNFRPISILPVMSKVLEKHVHDSLSEFLQEFNLLHKTQSGFRSKHSCETALVNMIDSWLAGIDSGKMIGVVLVDFKKGF